MNGKIAIVTGASTGIGRVTARELAAKGAHVVLVCRNKEKGEDAIREIKEVTKSDKLELLLCDMSSMEDITRAAKEFASKHDRLDILVNNAGAINPARVVTKDGLELTFEANHIGYFLFTHHLLDLLKKSAPSRIVNVASDAHKMGKINWDDLQSEKSFSSFGVYGTSKLMNILFTFELARRLEGTGVTVNCLHPGVIYSGFGQNSALVGLFYRIGSLFMKTVDQGAALQIYLATSPEVEGVTGKYFSGTKQATPTKAARDPELSARLWKVSEEITQKWLA